MPELSPQVEAMLAGQIPIPEPSGREKCFALAAIPAHVNARLARLVYDLRVAQYLGDQEDGKEARKMFRESCARHAERFGQVASAAARVGDRAFFRQADEILAAIERHLERDDPADYPLRVLILRVCESKRLPACTVAEMQHHLAGMTSAGFSADEIRNAMRAMGVLERSHS